VYSLSLHYCSPMRGLCNPAALVTGRGIINTAGFSGLQLWEDASTPSNTDPPAPRTCQSIQAGRQTPLLGQNLTAVSRGNQQVGSTRQGVGNREHHISCRQSRQPFLHPACTRPFWHRRQCVSCYFYHYICQPLCLERQVPSPTRDREGQCFHCLSLLLFRSHDHQNDHHHQCHHHQ
jgi:hypothetical protein